MWSPDRTRVVYFDGQPSVTSRLLVKAVTGTREAEPLVPSAADTTDKYATDWSADGRIVLFEENSPATGWDLRYVRLDGDRTASAVLQSRFAERQGQLSPDGRYLAYVSDESGQDEIYVTTFPGAAEKWAISSRGGTTPRWRRDGRELLFIDPEGTLQSVALLTGARFQADVPKPQFALNPIATDGWSYAISQDGKRLLVAQPAQAERSRSIFVLTNWPHRMTAPR